MPEPQTQRNVLVAFSFIAGLAVGVAGTLVALRTSAPAPGANATTSAASSPALTPAADTSANAPAAAAQTPGVFINETAVTQAQLDMLKQMHGAAPPPGHYWYDARSGLYGNWGFEAAGYIRPGHDFGDVPANASRGSTGVFINGREINVTEAAFFRRIFGVVYPGRWWLERQTGNVGAEGNPTPLANIVVALQQASGRGGGGGDDGGYRWVDNINGSSGGAVNGCVWVNSPGSSYSSAGCN